MNEPADALAAMPHDADWPLWTEPQAARVLNLALRTLQEHRRSGRSPTYIELEDGTVRYRPRDLRVWVQERAVASRWVGYAPRRIPVEAVFT
jgi:hypothetical protein